MTQKRKIMTVFASLSVSGAIAASAAMGDPAAMAQALKDRFSKEASILGLPVEEIKNAWAEGKTIHDIAKEKGMSEADLQAKMEKLQADAVRERMQALVDAGVITQEQADKRIELMKSKVLKKGKQQKLKGEKKVERKKELR